MCGKKIVFLGFGGPSAKSITLLRVSVQLAPPRMIAFVLLGVGAGAEPLKQLAVFP